MILLIEFLYYVVGIGLTDDAYQYVWFVLLLLLLCLFGIDWTQVADVSFDEDEEILQQLLSFEWWKLCLLFILSSGTLSSSCTCLDLDPWGC